MTRTYRVEAVTKRPRRTHDDFIRPFRAVTMTRAEEGCMLHPSLSAGEGWKAVDVVEIDDTEVRGAFAREKGR